MNRIIISAVNATPNVTRKEESCKKRITRKNTGHAKRARKLEKETERERARETERDRESVCVCVCVCAAISVPEVKRRFVCSFCSEKQNVRRRQVRAGLLATAPHHRRAKNHPLGLWVSSNLCTELI